MIASRNPELDDLNGLVINSPFRLEDSIKKPQIRNDQIRELVDLYALRQILSINRMIKEEHPD